MLCCRWVSVLMGFFSLLVFTPYVFKEWDVASEERERTLAKLASLKVKINQSTCLSDVLYSSN